MSRSHSLQMKESADFTKFNGISVKNKKKSSQKSWETHQILFTKEIVRIIEKNITKMAFSNSIPVEKAMTMSLGKFGVLQNSRLWISSNFSDEIIKETNIYVAPKRGGNKHLREEFRGNFLYFSPKYFIS